MKNTTDIQTIRLILGRYYSGDASGEDIARLKQFFAATPDVPADLEADKALFNMMSATDPTDEDMDVPDGLEQTLSGIAIAPKSRRLRFPVIAAAAAVIALLATCAIYILKPSPTVTPPLIAEVIVGAAPQATDAEETDTITAIDYVATESQAPRQAIARDKASDPYIEVTDSAEAARITVDALRKMRRTMNVAMNTTEEITGKNIENISKVKQIIKRIQ